jgi:hypothetical protein
MLLKDITIGLGITGSFCNFEKLENIIKELIQEGAKIVPITSYSVKKEKNRFTTSKEFSRYYGYTSLYWQYNCKTCEFSIRHSCFNGYKKSSKKQRISSYRYIHK